MFFKKKGTVSKMDTQATPVADETITTVEAVAQAIPEPTASAPAPVAPTPSPTPDPVVAEAPAANHGQPLLSCTDLATLQKAVAQLYQIVADLQATESVTQGDNWYFRKATTIVNSRANQRVKAVDGVLYMVADGS